MGKPRYVAAKSKWSLLVTDVATGETFYALNPDTMALTGSTRKLFSVGMALHTLGADHREITPVHRTGTVDAHGTLNGNLVLVGGGDLTFGGRRIDASTVQYTDFDHNDANSLGTALLTPQDPLYAVQQLAAQVKASGISSVDGEVVVDDRLFTPYRVPNGHLLITPILVNENMIDVTIVPTDVGQPATIEYRPQSSAFTLGGSVKTSAPNSASTVSLSEEGLLSCIGTSGCTATVSGSLPSDYRAPMTGSPSYVGTFRVEDPASFARAVFIDALNASGVKVRASAEAENPFSLLPRQPHYPTLTRVGSFESAPYAQHARLILKVSLNLGANLSLSLFGLHSGQRTIQGALAAERNALIDEFEINGVQFAFPTNGSGTPDSRATPRALVQLLTAMTQTKVAAVYQDALPVMGVDGSLAHTGVSLPGKGHVFAKPGTTIMAGADGNEYELKAQNLAGYIKTRSGRTVAYALMVNDAGPVANIQNDVGAVFEDEGTISSIIYESL